jgi:hypothetical protein
MLQGNYFFVMQKSLKTSMVNVRCIYSGIYTHIVRPNCCVGMTHQQLGVGPVQMMATFAPLRILNHIQVEFEFRFLQENFFFLQFFHWNCPV